MNTGDLAELDYGLAMSVRALVQAMGMNAANADSVSRGDGVKYKERDFQQLLEDNDLNHNAVISRWECREKNKTGV